MFPVAVLFATNSAPLNVPNVFGATAKPHGWFNGLPWAKRFHERSIFPENVDVSAGCAGRAGVCHIHLTRNILDPERRKAGRNRAVGERLHQVEIAVVNVHLIIGAVGREQEIPRRVGS